MTRNQNKTEARHANALKRLAPVEPRWPSCECVEEEDEPVRPTERETREAFENAIRKEQ